MRSVNIVGCGRLGQTLGRLFAAQGGFVIQDIVTSSIDSARQAVGFIGAGVPCVLLTEVRPADIVLIATPDAAISETAMQLARLSRIKRDCVAFHCSGMLRADVLAPLRSLGAHIASIHPVKSFSTPEKAAATFAGTFCGVEGEVAGVKAVTEYFQSFGARVFAVRDDSKELYHSAFVFACNYLTALMECALECCSAAGINRSEAAEIIGPLVRETTEAVLSQGVDSALTGPVVRGDAELVTQQLSCLQQWRPDYAQLYRLLGQVALQIATRGGLVNGATRDKVELALKN